MWARRALVLLRLSVARDADEGAWLLRTLSARNGRPVVLRGLLSAILLLSLAVYGLAFLGGLPLPIVWSLGTFAVGTPLVLWRLYSVFNHMIGEAKEACDSHPIGSVNECHI